MFYTYTNKQLYNTYMIKYKKITSIIYAKFYWNIYILHYKQYYNIFHIKIYQFTCISNYNGVSGEWGWGDLLIPIPILAYGDESCPYPSPNRWIPHGFAGNGAPLPSLGLHDSKLFPLYYFVWKKKIFSRYHFVNITFFKTLKGLVKILLRFLIITKLSWQLCKKNPS
jgi:hypothetical protein